MTIVVDGERGVDEPGHSAWAFHMAYGGGDGGHLYGSRPVVVRGILRGTFRGRFDQVGFVRRLGGGRFLYSYADGLDIS